MLRAKAKVDHLLQLCATRPAGRKRKRTRLGLIDAARKKINIVAQMKRAKNHGDAADFIPHPLAQHYVLPQPLISSVSAESRELFRLQIAPSARELRHARRHAEMI